MCFVNNLMLFCKAEEKSIMLLRYALEIFKGCLGLKANVKKSNIFFSSDVMPCHRSIATKLGFEVGFLPKSNTLVFF